MDNQQGSNAQKSNGIFFQLMCETFDDIVLQSNANQHHPFPSSFEVAHYDVRQYVN